MEGKTIWWRREKATRVHTVTRETESERSTHPDACVHALSRTTGRRSDLQRVSFRSLVRCVLVRERARSKLMRE
jgi:hypothetical protein